MRYAIDLWAFREPDTALVDLVSEFADFGFDGVSVAANQILDLDRRACDPLVALLRERDLVVTVHANFSGLSLSGATDLLRRLGESLHAITFDPLTRAEPRGVLYDVASMSALLQQIIEASDGSGLCVGVEDFPLEGSAVEFYREDLEPLLACPRYGMLVDVGHLNLKLRREGYWQGVSISDYFGRLPLNVVEIHLHDNLGERDDHAHLGFGNVPLDEVAAGLKTVGFSGVSTFEITPAYHGSSLTEARPRALDSLERWKGIWAGTQAHGPSTAPPPE